MNQESPAPSNFELRLLEPVRIVVDFSLPIHALKRVVSVYIITKDSHDE